MSGLSKVSQILHQALAKPSDSPDGLTRTEDSPAFSPQVISKLLPDIRYQAKNGSLTPAGETLLQGLVERPGVGRPLDDRKLLLEHGVSLMQHLPPTSAVGLDIAQKFIGLLWNDLPHPPSSFVGKTALYRQPDGSGNNPVLPDLGRAGTPYARSVPPVRPKPAVLPDPGLVFDMLLRRKEDEFKEHPSGISSLFFSFATIVIHECFSTSPTDASINQTSSYVDLSTLYGNNLDEQEAVRTLCGLGTLYPDTISSLSLMMMPPAVSVLLTIFSRNHNIIAKKLFDINEQGKYTTPDHSIKRTLQKDIEKGDAASLKHRTQDDDIFNKARKDLGAEIKTKDGRLARGGGNAVSVEFNVAYHWHAAMSAHDATWIATAFKDMLLINNAIEEPAHAFGAFGSPAALRVCLLSPLTRARNDWGCCTMNEFRQYLSLKTFDTFEEWNPDPVVANAARALYGHVDDLELYPGLLAEEPKPSMAGSGTCTGHTIGRGILDDAVSLVRSDRFLSYDFNTSTLTSWGVSSLKKAPGSPCGFFPSLLFSALPGAFAYNSTYALLPFYTPKAAKEILTGLGTISQYSAERAPANATLPTLQSIQSFDACKAAFADNERFSVLYNTSVDMITAGRGFMIGFDDKDSHDPASARMMAAFYQPNFEKDTSGFFSRLTEHQIKVSSLPYANSATCRLDIVRDVCNVVAIEWIANRFALPIKRKETPHGLISIPDLRMMLLGLFNFSTFDLLPKNGWLLRETSIASSAALTKLIKARVTTASGWANIALDFLSKNTAYEESAEAERFYKALQGTGVDADQLAGDCIGIMAPIAGNITQQVALLVELFLRDEYKEDRAKIAALAATGSDDQLLMGYLREGMRIVGVVPGLPRVAAEDMVIQDGERTLHFAKGDKLIIGISKAHMDPVAFPNPTKLDPTRPQSAYILLGYGLHFCFGARLADVAIMASIKTIFKLKNLRRAEGRAGSFIKTTSLFAGGLEINTYLDQSSAEVPAPVTLHVLYDV
ncbi:hypothetical protein RQP46_002753 [Phenoliferia psychrophenolica]